MGKVSLRKIYKPSKDVVARDVAGEFIIIPITSGIGDIEDEIYTLNETGKAIWDKLDGNRNLREVAEILASEYRGSPGDIEKDVAGLVEELLTRRMVVEVR